jgi:hypothetical protein
MFAGSPNANSHPRSVVMNHYIVKKTMHLQNSNISHRKKYASRIEIDCWKSQILLGVLHLYVHNNPSYNSWCYDLKKYTQIDAEILLRHRDF